VVVGCNYNGYSNQTADMLATFHFSFWELFTAPRIFIGKHLIWRAYRKGFPLFHSIKAYSHNNEKTYAKHLLTSWYQNPSLTTLETDVASIVAIKDVLRETIQTSKLTVGGDTRIFEAIKSSHKHAWEIIINELSKMARHFNEIKTLIISMLTHSNLKIRETALLVMEDGKFSQSEKKHYYSIMMADSSKKIRERAIDMIVRENRKFRLELKPVLSSMLDTEKDQDIIDGLKYALTKK
jgi:hypothetical protein